MLSKYLKILFYLVIGGYLIWFGVKANAATPMKSVAVSSNQNLEAAFQKYKKAKTLKVGVKKSLKSEFRPKETIYAGSISIQGNKLRWETETPEKSLILIDDSTVWTVSYPPADFDVPVQVTKSKIAKSSEDRLLLSTLLGTKNVFDSYKVAKKSEKDGIETYELEALKPTPQVQNLKIGIDTKKKEITRAEYQDELGNITKLEFEKLQIDPSFKKNHFKFVAPKNSQITEL